MFVQQIHFPTQLWTPLVCLGQFTMRELREQPLKGGAMASAEDNDRKKIRRGNSAATSIELCAALTKQPITLSLAEVVAHRTAPTHGIVLVALGDQMEQVRHHNVRAIPRHKCTLPILPLATALVADKPDHRTLALGECWGGIPHVLKLKTK